MYNIKLKEVRGLVKFYSKEEQELISHLNSRLGMNYRTKPYDLNNPLDLIELAIQYTGEFFDMTQYCSLLAEVNAGFDESVETFYPEGWAKSSLTGDTGYPRLNELSKLINHTFNLLSDLSNEAADRCAEIWRLILTQQNEVVIQHFFWGPLPQLDESAFAALEELSELFDECEYKRNIEEATTEFTKILRKRLFPNEAA